MHPPAPAIVLYENFAVVLNEDQKAPVEVADALEEALSLENLVSQSGTDGVRPVLCIRFALYRRYGRNGAARVWPHSSQAERLVLVVASERYSLVLFPYFISKAVAAVHHDCNHSHSALLKFARGCWGSVTSMGRSQPLSPTQSIPCFVA